MLLIILSLKFYFSVLCPSQPVVSNGSVICSLGDDGVTSYEDTCGIQCDVGYELMGSNTLMCHANGTWNSSSTCVRGKSLKNILLNIIQLVLHNTLNAANFLPIFFF